MISCSPLDGYDPPGGSHGDPHPTAGIASGARRRGGVADSGAGGATGDAGDRVSPQQFERSGSRVVSLFASDPAKAGLVASDSRPGGSLTGVNMLAASLGPKRFEVLHELLPKKKPHRCLG